MIKKIQDAGYRMVEVPVHHFYRQYGTSQFFNVARVGRTLLQVWSWWRRLVMEKEAVRKYRAKREEQVAGGKRQVTGDKMQVAR